MHTAVDRPQSPEERELQAKQAEFARLQPTLAQRELELERFRLELAAFERLYQSVVGVRYAELEAIEAQIVETETRQSLLAQRARAPVPEGRAQLGAAFEPSPDGTTAP